MVIVASSASKHVTLAEATVAESTGGSVINRAALSVITQSGLAASLICKLYDPDARSANYLLACHVVPPSMLYP